MTEFLRNAWPGWKNYTDGGKLAALLLAALLFLCVSSRRKTQGALLLYTTVMTVCCILPVTAAVLMLYQTKFYDYEWIWGLVPLTAVTAWGLTLFLAWLWEDAKLERRSALAVTLLLGGIVLLCGSLGGKAAGGNITQEERERAVRAAEQLAGRYPGEEICLWAPREVMEYAREADASLLLPYGRNLWDDFLNAYAYDVYGEDSLAMAGWMAWAGETGEADWTAEIPESDGEETDGKSRTVTLEESVDMALTAGVNCILLPGNVQPETVSRMEAALGSEAQVLEGYFLFKAE